MSRGWAATTGSRHVSRPVSKHVSKHMSKHIKTKIPWSETPSPYDPTFEYPRVSPIGRGPALVARSEAPKFPYAFNDTMRLFSTLRANGRCAFFPGEESWPPEDPIEFAPSIALSSLARHLANPGAADLAYLSMAAKRAIRRDVYAKAQRGAFDAAKRELNDSRAKELEKSLKAIRKNLRVRSLAPANRELEALHLEAAGLRAVVDTPAHRASARHEWEAKTAARRAQTGRALGVVRAEAAALLAHVWNEAREIARLRAKLGMPVVDIGMDADEVVQLIGIDDAAVVRWIERVEASWEGL